MTSFRNRLATAVLVAPLTFGLSLASAAGAPDCVAKKSAEMSQYLAVKAGLDRANQLNNDQKRQDDAACRSIGNVTQLRNCQLQAQERYNLASIVNRQQQIRAASEHEVRLAEINASCQTSGRCVDAGYEAETLRLQIEEIREEADKQIADLECQKLGVGDAGRACLQRSQATFATERNATMKGLSRASATHTANLPAITAQCAASSAPPSNAGQPPVGTVSGAMNWTDQYGNIYPIDNRYIAMYQGRQFAWPNTMSIRTPYGGNQDGNWVLDTNPASFIRDQYGSPMARYVESDGRSIYRYGTQIAG